MGFIRLKLRRGTTAEWTAANPVLGDGEPGYDKDLKVLKIGDGVTVWNDLAAQGGGGGGSVSDSWPIGSIFLSGVSTNPATLLGIGTWSLISQGQVLVGYKAGDPDFGTLGATPGAKTATPDAHAGGAVTRGTSGATVGNHADHVHAGPADHAVHLHPDAHTHNIAHTHGTASKVGTGAATVKDAALGTTASGARSAADTGNNAATQAHGNTGNPTAALTHTVTEPNAGAGHDHGFTQPSAHAALSVIQPSLVCYIWQRTA
jgi:hypothetical protein